MSPAIDTELLAKVNRLNELLVEVRQYKFTHPESCVGYYPNDPGSLLNAYREGDIGFYECISLLKDSVYSHLRMENVRLQDAIRRHRDQRGDDRCWMDDEELYAVLPEGYTPPARDTAVELKNCERFIASRRNPTTEYVSPEREIEQLRARLLVYEYDVRSNS
jgi:hypothetical protein